MPWGSTIPPRGSKRWPKFSLERIAAVGSAVAVVIAQGALRRNVALNSNEENYPACHGTGVCPTCAEQRGITTPG